MNSKFDKIKKNLMYGFGSFFIRLVLGFIGRKIFLEYLGVYYVGIDSIFLNIVSLLSLAELGIGNTIIYSLYKPLVENNKEKIKMLMNFYKKAYNLVGISIIIFGILLIPFLNKILNSDKVSTQIYLIFILYLINASLTYFYSYKSTLLIADQKNYIVNLINNGIYIIQFLIQILVLVLKKDFLLYLLIQSFFVIFYNIYISKKTVEIYPYLLEKSEKLSKIEEKNILENIKATMIIKISGLLVNNTDNLIINNILGTLVLGKTSNYTLIISAINSILNQLFNSMTSTIGHLNTENDIEKKYIIFKSINFLNYICFGIFSLGFIFLANDFIKLWIGKKYVLNNGLVILLGLNLYMFGMQNTIIMYKNTMGLFTQGKYLLLLTAFINLVLSIALGKVIGINGIFLATLIARITTNFWYHPYIVYKYGLKKKFVEYIIRYLKFFIIIIISSIINEILSKNFVVEGIVDFLRKGTILSSINLFVLIIFFIKSDEVILLKSKIMKKNDALKNLQRKYIN